MTSFFDSNRLLLVRCELSQPLWPLQLAKRHSPDHLCAHIGHLRVVGEDENQIVPQRSYALAVCALSLTAHWAFMFWSAQHVRRLPEVAEWTPAAKTELVSVVVVVLMVSSIAGNFLSAALARWLGYRGTIALLALAYFVSMTFTYSQPRTLATMWWCFPAIGCCSGFFALFTMYLPPLFPTLLRTTGAGFCYNFGRIIAAAGTVYFGLTAAGQLGDYAKTLYYAGFLFIPAALIAMLLPEEKAEAGDGMMVAD